jgi:hypothetical protein
VNQEIVAIKKIKKSIILERNKLESIRVEREVLKGTGTSSVILKLPSFLREPLVGKTYLLISRRETFVLRNGLMVFTIDVTL